MRRAAASRINGNVIDECNRETLCIECSASKDSRMILIIDRVALPILSSARLSASSGGSPSRPKEHAVGEAATGFEDVCRQHSRGWRLTAPPSA